jgi:hypothetical protein
MNPEQIKEEIRKLNSCDRIGLYRWINEEIAGRPGIGADRSLQIRKEIEGMCKSAHLKTDFLERRKRNPSRRLSPSAETRCRLVKIMIGLASDEVWSSPVFQLVSRYSDDSDVSIQSSHDSCQKKEKVEHLDLTLDESVQAKDQPLP